MNTVQKWKEIKNFIADRLWQTTREFCLKPHIFIEIYLLTAFMTKLEASIKTCK